jgi:DNA-binding PadR family transcriptional regulator
MHPYRIQALIKHRGKDEIANVAQRNSVYQTIAALHRAGLIAILETARQESRPERTVYEITASGRATLDRWLREALAVPAREFPDFPAALSLASMLSPQELSESLSRRAQSLELRLAHLEQPAPGIPRLFLIENEYMAAMVRTELAWVRALIQDLDSGALAWDEAWLKDAAERLRVPD